MRGSKRRAKPSRGRRRQSPTVRTPIVASVSRLRSGQRVTDSGSVASRLASSTRLRIIADCPARAIQSAASGVGVSDNETSRPAARSSVHSWSQRRRTPPNSLRLPWISSNTASGGSRLTRGVKCSSDHSASVWSNQRSRRGSRANVCSCGDKARAELSAMPGAMPAAAATGLQSHTTLLSRSRSITATDSFGRPCISFFRDVSMRAADKACFAFSVATTSASVVAVTTVTAVLALKAAIALPSASSMERGRCSASQSSRTACRAMAPSPRTATGDCGSTTSNSGFVAEAGSERKSGNERCPDMRQGRRHAGVAVENPSSCIYIQLLDGYPASI